MTLKPAKFWPPRIWRRDLILWVLSGAAWAALAVYLAFSHGRLDFQNHAVGRDFVNAWTAGHLVREGRTLSIFDPRPFLTGARRLFDPRLPFHFWSYPPPTLLMVAPLGWTGYFTGLFLWSGLGLLAAYGGLRTFQRLPELQARPRLLWLVLLAPATVTNLVLGQNGAFSAALLIAGLALLDRRPIAAGLVLGLLVFKPQIALLLPVMVMAGGRWRTMGAAAVSAGALVAASFALFGLDAWRAFIADTLPMQTQMLRFGAGPFQTMMPSPYMTVRHLHVVWAWAMAAQAPFTLFGGWLVWRAWRSEADAGVRAGVLMAATFIASPQAFNYDLIPAALAGAILWRISRRWWDAILVAVLWALPALMAATMAKTLFIALKTGPASYVVVIAPLTLTLLAWRLAWVGGVFRRPPSGEDRRPSAYSPSRAPKASTGAQVASNT